MSIKAEGALDVSQIPELVIRRTFKAPRSLVFKAWLDPRQVAVWWSPDGFTNPLCEIDPRPGGAIMVHMKGPDGSVYPCGGAFVEIDEPGRLVLTTFAEDADGSVLLKNLVTLTFEEEGEHTRLTLRVRVTEAKAKAAPMMTGMVQGWTEQTERLGAFVEGSGVPFSVFRSFQAPREMVFQALTDPAQLNRWFSPPGSEVLKAQMDLKQGGSYHYGLRTSDGREQWGRQVYVEVVPFSRLVYIQSFSNKDGGIAPNPLSSIWPKEMLSTLALEEQGDTTILKITWKPLRATKAEVGAFNSAHGGMSGGFKVMFDQLEGHLSGFAERCIVVSRLVDAPRTLVYRAFTDPRHVNAWWGPDGFKNTDVEEMDVRVGGTWRFKMLGPDGQAYPNVIVYRELKEPERLVWDHGDGAQLTFRGTVTFEEKHGKTLVTITHRFASKEVRDRIAEQHHAVEGARQTLTKLATYLKTL